MCIFCKGQILRNKGFLVQLQANPVMVLMDKCPQKAITEVLELVLEAANSDNKIP